MPVQSTSWADGQTVHGTDVDVWTAAINTSGITSQATANSTLTLNTTVGNAQGNQVQVFTGNTVGQIVALPTTSVPAGYSILIINLSSVNVTVNSSGGGTVLVVAPNTSAALTAAITTPVNAADWDAMYGAVTVASGKSLTVTNLLTLAGVDGKALSINNNLTFAGTDGTTMTFPAASGYVSVSDTGTPGATLTAAVATGAVAATKMASFAIPANKVIAGDTFRIKLIGTQSTTATTVTFGIRCGTANSSADVLVSSAAPAVVASGGAWFDGLFTIRTIGSGGTCIAGCIGEANSTATTTGTASTAVNAALSAINASKAVSATTATQTINTTVANYLGVYATVTAGTFSAQVCAIAEVL